MNDSKEEQLPAPGRDHEHVDRISSQTTIFVLVAILFLLYAVRWILLPFVLSGLLAYICTPAIEWLRARTGVPRALVATGVFLLLLAIAALSAQILVPPLIAESTRVLTDLQKVVESLAGGTLGTKTISVFGEPMDAAQVSQAVVTALRNWLGDPGRMALFGGVAFASVFGLFLSLVLLFYFLLNGPEIAQGLLRLSPPMQRPLLHHIWTRVDPVLKRYFVGVVVVVAYAASAAYVGLGLVLGIPHAVILALLTGVLEMIPMVGPGAAAVIAGIVAVHYATGVGPIIAYAIYAAALRLSIDQLFGPLALGTAARVHPVLVIFCFLAGGLLFGIPGVILAIPVALTVKVTLAILYDESTGRAEPKAR
ncbi:MAG TPA: AI-2E family transporter [Xanthobacteraceae bacterium]|jgi:predicted PurR-regulated permease PerM